MECTNLGCPELTQRQKVDVSSTRTPITVEDLRKVSEQLKPFIAHKPPAFKSFYFVHGVEMEETYLRTQQALLKAVEEAHHRAVIQVLTEYRANGARCFSVMSLNIFSSPVLPEPDKMYFVDTMDELRAALAQGVTTLGGKVFIGLTDKFTTTYAV